jgi:hypothetical protein
MCEHRGVSPTGQVASQSLRIARGLWQVFVRLMQLFPQALEPIRKVVESRESDVIHCRAPESKQGVLDVEA